MTYELILVDAKNALWRASEAHPELGVVTDGHFEPTGAVYGFLHILIRAREEIGGTPIVCWDSYNKPLERKRMYPGYKQKRLMVAPDLLSEMNRQMFRLMHLLSLAGISQAYSPGWEADDVMGKLARQLGGERDLAIFTGDRDLYQCIEGNTVIVRPQPKGTFKVETAQSVEATWDVPPAMWVDFKALAGDVGDCIPGCPGIGPKWAAKILKVFHSIDFLLDNLAFWGGSNLPERLRDLIVANEEQIRLSYELAKINCEVPLKFLTPSPSEKRLVHELHQLKFRSILHSGGHKQLLSMAL